MIEGFTLNRLKHPCGYASDLNEVVFGFKDCPCVTDAKVSDHDFVRPGRTHARFSKNDVPGMKIAMIDVCKKTIASKEQQTTQDSLDIHYAESLFPNPLRKIVPIDEIKNQYTIILLMEEKFIESHGIGLTSEKMCFPALCLPSRSQLLAGDELQRALATVFPFCPKNVSAPATSPILHDTVQPVVERTTNESYKIFRQFAHQQFIPAS